MQLDEKQREAIKQRQIANIIAKLNAGKTITAREQALLDGDDGTVYSQNKNALSEALGVNRRTLFNAWKAFAKDRPKKRADGRYCISDYRSWLENNGVRRRDHPSDRGRDQAEHGAGPGDQQPNKAHWDREKARVDYERAVFNLEIERGKFVELDEICAAVGQMLSGFRTAINMLPGSAARWLIGLKDFQSIKGRLETEVHDVLQSLGRCDYMDTLAASIAENLFRDDPDQFRKRATAAAEAIVIEIGRRALSDLMQKELREIPKQVGYCSDPLQKSSE